MKQHYLSLSLSKLKTVMMIKALAVLLLVCMASAQNLRRNTNKITLISFSTRNTQSSISLLRPVKGDQQPDQEQAHGRDRLGQHGPHHASSRSRERAPGHTCTSAGRLRPELRATGKRRGGYDRACTQRTSARRGSGSRRGTSLRRCLPGRYLGRRIEVYCGFRCNRCPLLLVRELLKEELGQIGELVEDSDHNLALVPNSFVQIQQQETIMVI